MAKSKKTARTVRKTAARKTAKKVPAKKAPSAPTLRTLTPHLGLNDCAGAIEWYKKAFGAKETSRMPGPDGKIMHASMRIGDSDLFLADIWPGSDVVDASRAGASVTLHLWQRNVDKLWERAVAAGAKVTMPIDDQFWGDRYGRLLDPYGHSWSLAGKSKLSKAELQKKAAEAMAQMGQ